MRKPTPDHIETLEKLIRAAKAEARYYQYDLTAEPQRVIVALQAGRDALLAAKTTRCSLPVLGVVH